jgi:hypothetical protein
MFKHILWPYRDIETGGEESAPGSEPAPVEQPAENAETPQQPNDGYPEDTQPWVKQRMSKLAQQKREERQRADDLQRQLDELRAQQTRHTPDQVADMSQEQLQQYVQALAAQQAEQLYQQRTVQSAKQQKWQQIENQGTEGHGPEFLAAAQRLHDYGATNAHFVDALEEIDEAADILVYLGQEQNIEEAARIAALPPVKMAIELARLGSKAKTELKKTRSASKAPPPPSPVGGHGATPGAGKEPPTGSPEWFEWRNKQVAARRGH